jgi:hypothetical protein
MAPLLLLLRLLLLPVLLLLAAGDEYPASCIKASCAGVDVHYPFWLNSSGSDSCGYPGLGLACEMNNSRLILAVHSHSYRVINIDYTNHTIAVSDTDANGGCPRLHANLTIDYTSSWLQPTPSDSNITFLYNCTKNMSWPSAVELLGCREEYDNRRRRSYVLPDGVTTGTEAYDYQCDEVVVAPVLSAHKMGMMGSTPGGIPPVVNGSFGPVGVVIAGFELMYNTHSQQCDGCESSGGWCGYRRNNHTNGAMGFACFCDSGPTPERCGAYVSSSPRITTPVCWFSVDSRFRMRCSSA